MHLKDWIGRTQTLEDEITPTPIAALAGVLDRDATRPAKGTPIPPMWHWLYFLPLARQSEIGPDGHPHRGDFLPPVELPRRMFAGSRTQFSRPLCIGDRIRRTSSVEDVSEKSGRSGRLLFVKVKHEIRANDAAEPALTELHDIVYREAPKPGDPASTPQPAPASAKWEKKWVPDDVLLFRYSALTFNGHRIHYDRRYVTEVEGYPGLVVHGPLIATLLLDLLRWQMPEARVESYEFRAMRPLFDLHPFDVCGEPLPGGKSIRLWARNHEGALAMDATARIA